MKKTMFVGILCLMLCGCGSQSAELPAQSALDVQSIPYNTQKIKDILNENVWNYDEDSITFGNDLILSSEGENYSLICEASEEAGIDTRRFKRGANQTMLASVRLYSSDMSDAGTAYFAFDKRELLCGYYMYNNTCQSLTNKYPFEYAAPFKAAEDKTKQAAFDSIEQKTAFGSVGDIYGGNTAVLSGSALVFYADTQNGLKRRDVITFDDELMPVSVSLGDKYAAVLLDSYEIAEAGYSDYEVCEDGPDIVNQKSEKIVFTDTDGSKAAADIPLELSIYSSVAQLDDGRVAAVRNNAIDIFKRTDDGWKKDERLSIDTSAEKMRVVDIDGDGSEEYIISDGVNIFVYTKPDMLKLAWRTKYDISTINDFFAADLNSDGVKELYVNDSNGFVTCYILGQKGFYISDSDINGESAYFAAGDINGSGDGYITVSEEKMYICNQK